MWFQGFTEHVIKLSLCYFNFLLQEELQKEAFKALQMQRDSKHQRIRGQIELIEQELAQLTQLEVEQRELKLNIQMVSGRAWLKVYLSLVLFIQGI